MNRPPRTFAANPAVLNDFVRAVATAGDSPTVVRRVAENAAYVYLCREIVQMDGTRLPPLLKDACREAVIAPSRLLARLAPVAQALRLVPANRDDTYYTLLGVSPESDAALIRRAFRRRARHLHPDLQKEPATDSQAFAKLTTAYQTLRDPAAKQAYDERHATDGTWFEPERQTAPARSRRTRLTAVIVVVALLVAATLVLDHLYRENTRQTAYRTASTETTRPVSPPVQPDTVPRAAPPRVAEATAAAEVPATVATAPTPAVVIPVTPPVVVSAAPPRTVPHSPTPVREPDHPGPAATPDPPATLETTPLPGTRVADHRRVTVFYAAASEARLSGKLAALLADQGYPPPRIARAPSNRVCNIRYFNAADRDAARSLHGTVQRFLTQATGRPDLPVELKNLSRRYPRAEQGLLEVWINTGRPAAVPATGAPVTTASASTPAPPAGTLPGAPDPAVPVDTRIRAFLDNYCRTYESRDPDRLADLFDTRATENGQPFVEVLPRYRTNMARIARLSYRIELERWKRLADAETLSVQGRFFADGQLSDRKHYHSQGTIVLDIVPHGESYRVARLAYQIE